jgi:hypothetical protein
LYSYSSEDEVEGITLVQLNKEKKRDAQELKDDAHADEDGDASVSSTQTEGNSSSSSDAEQEEEEKELQEPRESQEVLADEILPAKDVWRGGDHEVY